MPFRSILSLGLPITKLLLRFTNGGSASASEVLSDLQSLLGATQTTADRREIRRQLEQISDMVLRRIDRFITTEFRDVDDGEVEAASLAVSAMVDQAASNPIEAALTNDLSGLKLYRWIHKRADWRSVDRDFSESGRRLVDALLKETSNYLVEVVKTFPQLTIEALGQMLGRQADLLQLMTDVARALDDLPRVLEATTSLPTPQRRKSETDEDFDQRLADYHSKRQLKRRDERDSRMDVDYRRAIIDKYDGIDLYGLDLGWATRHYSLTTAYISLRAASPNDGTPAMDRNTAMDGETIHSLLAERQQLVLSGQAGAGKTTILQWLAVTAARRRLDEGLQRFNQYLPVFVRLRDFVESHFPSATDLPAASVRDIGLDLPPEWVATRRNDGRFLLLIDGLDELPETKHVEFLAWLETILREFPNQPVITTTRPSATTLIKDVSALLRTKSASRREPLIAEVQPLDREQIYRCVAHWHRAIGRNYPAYQARLIERKSLKVAATIVGIRSFRLLATSPLLCAVLCALYHARSGALPETRLETYSALLNLLLVDRDKQRGVNIEPESLTLAHKHKILEDLAALLLANELSEVEEDRARDQVARTLSNLHVAELDPTQVLDLLVSRSGVLRKPAAGQVDFVHRTFLEYLAARSFVHNDRIEELARNASRSTWGYATVLAAGLGIKRQQDAIVDAIVSQAEATLKSASASKVFKRGRLSTTPSALVISCGDILQICSEIEPAQYDRILAILRSVVPPTSTDEANAFAAAGDALVSELVESLQRRPRSQDVLALSIKALGDIGSPRSLQALSEIPAEERLTAVASLIAIWSWYDLQDFSHTVLADLSPSELVTRLHSAELVPYTAGLSDGFKWLCDLHLPEAGLASDLQGSKLDELRIDNLELAEDENVRDGSFLWTVGTVRRVQLGRLQGFKGIARPNSTLSADLEELILNVPSGVIQSSALAAFKSLKRLTITGSGVLEDFTFLQPLVELEELVVRGSLRVLGAADDEPIELPNLTRLSWFHLGEPRWLFSITEGAHSLRSLSLRNIDGVGDLSWLSQNQELVSIELDDVSELEDVATIEWLPVLESLIVSGDHSLENVNDIRENLETSAVIEIVTEEDDEDESWRLVTSGEFSEFTPGSESDYDVNRREFRFRMRNEPSEYRFPDNGDLEDSDDIEDELHEDLDEWSLEWPDEEAEKAAEADAKGFKDPRWGEDQ